MRGNADNKSPLDKVRHIEGFPIGQDDGLQALCDPPYYATYPTSLIRRGYNATQMQEKLDEQARKRSQL